MILLDLTYGCFQTSCPKLFQKNHKINFAVQFYLRIVKDLPPRSLMMAAFEV